MTTAKLNAFRDAIQKTIMEALNAKMCEGFSVDCDQDAEKAMVFGLTNDHAMSFNINITVGVPNGLVNKTQVEFEALVDLMSTKTDEQLKAAVERLNMKPEQYRDQVLNQLATFEDRLHVVSALSR